MAISVKFAMVVVVVCMAVVAAPMAEAAITCGQVSSDLTPCLPFLLGGPAPSSECCAGVKSLYAAASTTPDRQAACKCMENAATSFSGLNVGNAAALAAKCGVNLPFKVSNSTNCDNIKA